MTRPSTIERLPPDILDQLHALLRDPRVTQLDATARINVILEEEGHEDRVTKSSVNRYKVRMDELGARIRESRQVAEMWVAKLGAAPQGQIGNLVNETLRTLSFELSHKLISGTLNDESMPGTVKMLKELSLSVMRLERASSENVKREQEIRDQVKREAVEVLEKVSHKGGLSAATKENFRRELLGIPS